MAKLIADNKVLIFDTHEVTRLGYRALLKEWRQDLRVVDTGSYAEALAWVGSEPWVAIIVEIACLERDGFEVLDQFCVAGVECPILVATVTEDDSFGIRVIRRGAAGFICKSAGAQEFITALSHILSGKKYLSASLAQKLISQVHPSYNIRPHESLSDREFQVLQKLAQGITIKHMAAELFLSSKTVSTYRVRIMTKLGFKNMVELVEYCVENGLTNKTTKSALKGCDDDAR